MREKSIAENAAVVGFMTLVSRVGGLVREVMMAHYFGAGVEKSAFTLAYRVPNLFRRLFGEGALSAALIPIYTETLEKEGKDEADRLASAVAGTAFAFLGIVCVVGVAATYPLARLLVPGSRWAPVLPLLRIMLPYAPLICLAALIMGVLNSLKSFALSALAPAFQNLCWILVLACVCPFLPDEGPFRIKAVSWSILVSGLIQVAVQLPALRRHAVPLRLAWARSAAPGVRRVFALMLPMALAAGVVQINVFLDGVLAMKAGEWGPAALDYADRLVYLPLALVGTAFATVLLPSLSSFHTAGDDAAFAAALERATRNVIAVLTPAAAGMIALATPIVVLIYEHGKFSPLSTGRTANALVAYCAGLVVAGLYKIVVSAFYARKDARTPVIVGTVGVALNLSLNLFFIWVLPPELKPIGIAIATSISSFIGCAALMALLSRRGEASARLFDFASVRRVAVASTISSALMGVAIWWCARFVGAHLPPHLPSMALHAAPLAAAAPVGAAIYFVLMRLLCPSALAELVQDFRRRRR